MGYSIHGEDARVFSFDSMDKLKQDADLNFFVATYKLTKLYNLVQKDIKMLIDMGVLEVSEDDEEFGYPYKEMEKSIIEIGSYLRYKLGDDVVDEWDNLIINGLNDNEIKKGALAILLEATSDCENIIDETEIIYELIEYVKQVENEW